MTPLPNQKELNERKKGGEIKEGGAG